MGSIEFEWQVAIFLYVLFYVCIELNNVDILFSQLYLYQKSMYFGSLTLCREVYAMHFTYMHTMHIYKIFFQSKYVEKMKKVILLKCMNVKNIICHESNFQDALSGSLSWQEEDPVILINLPFLHKKKKSRQTN